MNKKQEKNIIGQINDKDTEILSQGYEKLWNYFLEIVKTDFFQKSILAMREKNGIPKEGLEIEYYNFVFKEKESKVQSQVVSLCKRYQLHYLQWGEVIKHYLVSNKLPVYSTTYLQPNSYSLCTLVDLAHIRRKLSLSKDLMDEDDEIYPIGIRISPYASKRDIVDFINTIFPLIKGMQESYKKAGIKIGKVKKKKKSIQERNDFIYENRKLSINETKRLVEEKFGESLDYEYIGKIRSYEAKRRKKL